jgi:periplasmic protein TonB
MNNAISMYAEFERQKNLRALLLTGLISLSILLLVWFIRWSIPVMPKEPVAEVVEIILPEELSTDDINLGNNDVGSGNVQPIVTGTPSTNPVSDDATPSKGASSEATTKDIETDDNDHKAPEVAKPVNKTPSREINNNPNPQTVTAKKPDPRPKALMTSTRGTGNGGNTDLPGYNKPGGQGPGDGVGDKGMQNGNPNGTKYLGVKVVSIPNQSFEDDFKEGGKINLDIVVDANGGLVSASYKPGGSSLPKSSKQYSIALQRAREIRYPKMDGGFKQTLTFNFTVK